MRLNPIGTMEFKGLKGYFRLAAIASVMTLALGCQLTEVGSQSWLDQASPQYLPVGATAMINDTVIDLEVAATPEQQALGLMHRADLGENRGMLFPFDPPRKAAFWMKNTLMPLDIVFMNGQNVVTIHENVPPCEVQPCPTYPSAGPVNQVIELEAGQAKKLGIQEGDRIDVQFLSPQNQPSG